MQRARRLDPIAGLRLAVLGLGLLVLPACGFHLRGQYDIPEGLAPVRIDAPAGSGVARTLTETLRRNGVALADAGTKPRTRLSILSENSDRRVLSVGTNGKVDEYELVYTVHWRLVDADSGRERIATTRFQAQRDYVYDPAAVLGKQNEEETLTDDMRSDIADRIVFRLQALEPDTASGSSGQM